MVGTNGWLSLSTFTNTSPYLKMHNLGLIIQKYELTHWQNTINKEIQSKVVWGLRSLSAHMANHIEMADAIMIACVSLCYASDSNTLVTTPSTTSPTLQVWAACSQSHDSLEGEGRKLPHISPARQFLMAAPAPWPDRVWHMLPWRLTGRQT